MTAEFDWWLLIVGLVIGGGLVWLVVADTSRRDADLDEDELQAEAYWIAGRLRAGGTKIDQAAAEEVLHEHLAYLAERPAEDADVADVRPARAVPQTPAPAAPTAPREADSVAGHRADVEGHAAEPQAPVRHRHEPG